jgi:DNA-binding HxlR family transcriptional regulator
MALPHDYTGQACSLSRTLEIVGERWTLLIVRDAFYGVRRFSDFVAHLKLPRAVLTDRLNSLTAAGVLRRVPTFGRREEYQLTDKGLTLWPVVRSLTTWGDEHYAKTGPRRIFMHATDDGPLDVFGCCTRCGCSVAVQDTLVVPGPGLAPPTEDDDLITRALVGPHRLLHPMRG